MFRHSSSDDMNFIPDNMPRFPENTPLAMAYVPFQTWDCIYDENTAFCQGTVFPQLDFPFCGEEVARHD